MKGKKKVSYLPGAFGIGKVSEKFGQQLSQKADKQATKKSRGNTIHVASSNEVGPERNNYGQSITFIYEKDIQMVNNS